VKRKKLKSGYTTGACAAAAAKAAVLLVTNHASRVTAVEIPFPDGSRVKFRIQDSGFRVQERTAWASVIKDAGDDPDVTNGAEIVANVRVKSQESSVKNNDSDSDSKLVTLNSLLYLRGGIGVGMVTKPGLAISVGEPAINPVPRKMIESAVIEAVGAGSPRPSVGAIEITISVPNGEELAKKTLNKRLGIVGGISILGTTGIVKPVSTEAWTATITSSMDVAKAMGYKEIVLSAGRSSEKSHIQKYGLPEETYVLMGDYLEYSLQEAERHGFEKIILCAQWAKMVKIAMATPQTHVKFGAINVTKAVEFLNSLNINIPPDREFNTAREIYDWIFTHIDVGANGRSPLQQVCTAAKKYAENITGGSPVITYLISYDGKAIASSE
jgi:cobalt-precorrin-5B (C1)-methyltransferase